MLANFQKFFIKKYTFEKAKKTVFPDNGKKLIFKKNKYIFEITVPKNKKNHEKK